MLERVINTAALLGNWGYLVFFLAAFLESSAFLGLIVPGESIVVVAGLLASQGRLDLGYAIAAVSLGAILGDTFGYILGRGLGRGYFERNGRFLFFRMSHIEKAETYFRLHGGKTIFLGRFIGFLRAMAPFAAGVSKMPYGRFFFYNVTGGVLWAAAFTSLGYFFGLSWRAVEKWAGRAGVFVFFILAVLAGLGYIYGELLKRWPEIYIRLSARWKSFAASPKVSAFLERRRGLVGFLTERLSPRHYLGLHLTLGLVLCAVLAWIFGSVTEAVLTGEPLAAVDRAVLEYVLYFRTPHVTRFMLAYTRLGGPYAVISAGAVVSVVLAVKRRFDYLSGFLAAIAGASVIDLALKAAVRRPAPIVENHLIILQGWSFPSSHAMTSVVFYGMIGYFLAREMKSLRLRLLIALVFVFNAFLIGFSRIYLQAHYLSDVLAGYAGGFFWLTVCVTGLEVYRKRAGVKPR